MGNNPVSTIDPDGGWSLSQSQSNSSSGSSMGGSFPEAATRDVPTGLGTNYNPGTFGWNALGEPLDEFSVTTPDATQDLQVLAPDALTIDGGGGDLLTVYHNTTVQGAKGIFWTGFNARSGWNFFMTDPTGYKAGSDVAAMDIQLQVSIDVAGAHKISYVQYHDWFVEAKLELGFASNAKLTAAQQGMVDGLRMKKMVAYMEEVGADMYLIATEGGTGGQTFVAGRTSALSRVRSVNVVRGTADFMTELLADRTLIRRIGESLSQKPWFVRNLPRIAMFSRFAMECFTEIIIIEALMEYLRIVSDGELIRDYNRRLRSNPYRGFVIDGYHNTFFFEGLDIWGMISNYSRTFKQMEEEDRRTNPYHGFVYGGGY